MDAVGAQRSWSDATLWQNKLSPRNSAGGRNSGVGGWIIRAATAGISQIVRIVLRRNFGSGTAAAVLDSVHKTASPFRTALICEASSGRNLCITAVIVRKSNQPSDALYCRRVTRSDIRRALSGEDKCGETYRNSAFSRDGHVDITPSYTH